MCLSTAIHASWVCVRFCSEWVAWRVESTRRRMNFDLAKKTDRLHLLHGLEAILLDIDKAIAIIRGTKLEADVVPNLMKGFGIGRGAGGVRGRSRSCATSTRNTSSTARRTSRSCEGDIAELNEVLASEQRDQAGHPATSWSAVNKKHVTPRKTGLVEPADIVEVQPGARGGGIPRHHDALARRLPEEDDRARAAQGHHAEVQGWRRALYRVPVVEHPRAAGVHRSSSGVQVQGGAVRGHQVGAAGLVPAH